MFITKKHISRRTVLKGAGVTLGLPFLERMVPAATALAQTAAVPKLRTGFFYLPHGAIMSNTAHGPAMDQVDAQRLRRRFQAQPDSRLARAVQEVRYRLSAIWRTRPPRARFIRSLRRPGSAPPVRTPAVPRAHGHDSRSGDRENHRPGHAAALAGSLPRKPPFSRRRAAAGLIPLCLSATRNRPCRWNPIRARSSCSCSAKATRRRSARRSATRPTASWI